ncbi:hypothetical protein C0991_002818 [Blastosporella zonata]|nr:hypothetical protein C0991_002818 [Blastosporella zonata]
MDTHTEAQRWLSDDDRVRLVIKFELCGLFMKESDIIHWRLYAFFDELEHGSVIFDTSKSSNPRDFRLTSSIYTGRSMTRNRCAGGPLPVLTPTTIESILSVIERDGFHSYMLGQDRAGCRSYIRDLLSALQRRGVVDETCLAQLENYYNDAINKNPGWVPAEQGAGIPPH